VENTCLPLLQLIRDLHFVGFVEDSKGFCGHFGDWGVWME
jgi:hypothetical protein